MYRYTTIAAFFFFLAALLAPPAVAEKSASTQSPSLTTSTKKTEEQELARNKEEQMLLSIHQLRQMIEKQIASKNRQMEQTNSSDTKAALQEELVELQKSLQAAESDFEKMATGVDTSIFNAQEEEGAFNWKQELFDLVKPGIMELKQLTVEARRKAALLDKQSRYQELLPVAHEANANLKALFASTEAEVLKEQIEALQPQWESLEKQLISGLDITNIELAKMDNNQQSLWERSRASLLRFLHTRGLYLTIAVVACLLVILLMGLLHRVVRRMVPGHDRTWRPFHIRAIDLGFQVATVLVALFSFIIVFYVVEDWVLLSFAVIILLGLAWMTKTALPRFWKQSQMMLNAGPVREGERVILYGVPWLVENINLRTTLTNPDLDLTFKVMIYDLFDKTSRPFGAHEQWFPCRKDDWVILADGTRGGVVDLSHERVELVLRGGAHKTYQTPDFLSLAPVNLSRNFRIKEIFGIGYCHQQEATGVILKQLEAFLLERFTAEEYSDEMLNLRVEFTSAGASSLDLVVIADFKGSAAPIYNRLRRAIQRWCVDAATQYGWDIPFPQLTVHRGDTAAVLEEENNG
ncbi:MAG: hypothetical protein CSA34_00015 [Desulfobulbus propionicus]|nr:MAG: hypothetical protein CSA34_00015 [Desulfobulbus propionicus]